MPNFPTSNEELTKQYGRLKLVSTAEGWYLINEKLETALQDWIILPEEQRAGNPVSDLYFKNAFVPDLTELRFDDVWLPN